MRNPARQPAPEPEPSPLDGWVSGLVEVQKRLEQGEDFAVLAKEFSDDSGSAGDGGDQEQRVG